MQERTYPKRPEAIPRHPRSHWFPDPLGDAVGRRPALVRSLPMAVEDPIGDRMARWFQDHPIPEVERSFSRRSSFRASTGRLPPVCAAIYGRLWRGAERAKDPEGGAGP